MSSVTEPARAEEVHRVHFLGWQCRIRQHSIRHDGGRPSAGMRPEVSLDDRSLGQVTVMIVKTDPQDMTTQFRYMVKKTLDPAERYENAVKFLSAAYYQRAREFSGLLTALFGPGSELALALAREECCELRFEQYSQSYQLPCRVERLPETHSHYQATFWHNCLFNPEIPAGALVLGFSPDWERLQAEPPIA